MRTGKKGRKGDTEGKSFFSLREGISAPGRREAYERGGFVKAVFMRIFVEEVNFSLEKGKKEGSKEIKEKKSS